MDTCRLGGSTLEAAFHAQARTAWEKALREQGFAFLPLGKWLASERHPVIFSGPAQSSLRQKMDSKEAGSPVLQAGSTACQTTHISRRCAPPSRLCENPICAWVKPHCV